jgi:hypothetical protein
MEVPTQAAPREAWTVPWEGTHWGGGQCPASKVQRQDTDSKTAAVLGSPRAFFGGSLPWTSQGTLLTQSAHTLSSQCTCQVWVAGAVCTGGSRRWCFLDISHYPWPAWVHHILGTFSMAPRNSQAPGEGCCWQQQGSE